MDQNLYGILAFKARICSLGYRAGPMFVIFFLNEWHLSGCIHFSWFLSLTTVTLKIIHVVTYSRDESVCFCLVVFLLDMFFFKKMMILAK